MKQIEKDLIIERLDDLFAVSGRENPKQEDFEAFGDCYKRLIELLVYMTGYDLGEDYEDDFDEDEMDCDDCNNFNECKKSLKFSHGDLN